MSLMGSTSKPLVPTTAGAFPFSKMSRNDFRVARIVFLRKYPFACEENAQNLAPLAAGLFLLGRSASWRRPYFGIGCFRFLNGSLAPASLRGFSLRSSTPGSEPNSRVRIGIAGAVIGTLPSPSTAPSSPTWPRSGEGGVFFSVRFYAPFFIIIM